MAGSKNNGWPVLAPTLAVLAALFFALTSFASRVALERTNATTATLFSLLVNVVIFWGMFLILLPLDLLANWAVILFILAGIAGPLFGRLTFLMAIQRLGVSLAVPIYNSQVFFAAVGGILFLNETLSSLGGIGIITLMVGIGLLSADPVAGNIVRPKTKRTLLIPLVSGFFFGTSHVLRALGLDILPEVLLGLPIVVTAAFVGTLAILPVTGQKIHLPERDVLGLLFLAGLFTSVAQLCSLWSIYLGDLVVVIPLQNTTPFFTLIFAALFLKRLERITVSLLIGVTLVVIGGALVI